MENTRTYSVKGILTALGKSLLYLLFFLAVQLLAGILYAAVASLSPGGADAENILAGTETAVLLSYLLTAAAVLLWFRLRHRPLGEAVGLRRCSGWTAAFCAFCAVGLFVVVQLALTLLPATWMTGYNDHMDRLLSNGLIPALSIAVAAPLTEELMFRGVIQPRLERAMPVWAAVVVQAVLFGVTHGTPIQMVYAFLLGLVFGFLRSRTGSILPGFAAHAAFNAMNDPLGLFGDAAGSGYALAVMAAVSVAGCVLCRRGLASLAASVEQEARGTDFHASVSTGSE